MKKQTKKKGPPAPAPKPEVINVRISKGAYKVISDEAKITRRSFITTLDMMLGV